MKTNFFLILYCFYSFSVIFQSHLYAENQEVVFHSEPCFPKQNIDSNSPESLNRFTVDRQEWINKEELLIEGSVDENCAAEIMDGKYFLQGDTLLLKYTAKGIEANCNCMHKVSYLIRGLPKQKYQVIIECELRS